MGIRWWSLGFLLVDQQDLRALICPIDKLGHSSLFPGLSQRGGRVKCLVQGWVVHLGMTQVVTYLVHPSLLL